MDISAQLDQLIRSGEQGKARKILMSLKLTQIPLSDAAALADIARRLNLPKLMILILKPIVRSEKILTRPPTNRESALYATGISRIGVFAEAEEILHSLDGAENSQVWLFQAQNRMLQWDCEGAIPLLRRYISSTKISNYERLVGMVNLAACCIWSMDGIQGLATLEKIWSVVDPNDPGQKLIRAYSIELAAEMAIHSKNYTQAEEWVTAANKELAGTGSRYEFYAKKWQQILFLLRSPHDQKSLYSLREVRQEAVALSEWETARDCAFFEALAVRNDSLFLQTYNGTPHVSFRQRAKRLYQPDLPIPKTVTWNCGREILENENARCFDVYKGCENDGKNDLASGQLMLRLMEILSRDFFRPISMGTLVSELYPNEYYNPHSSPQKALQIITRLRQWFQKNTIPLKICAVTESFHLESVGDYSLKLTRRKPAQLKKAIPVERLKAFFGSRCFNSQQLSIELGVSTRSAQRILIQALKSKHVSRQASGRSTQYKVIL